MALIDPIAVYRAANNLEAHFVCNLLNEADIEAAVVEDVSQMGTWMGGLVSQIHRPQVWVERTEADRARPVLDDYERRQIERQAPQATDAMIPATCEDCGATSSFPIATKGSVQNCPACGAFVDVEMDADSGEWAAEVEE